MDGSGSNVVLWIGLIAFAGAILYSIFGKPQEKQVVARTRPSVDDLKPTPIDHGAQILTEIRNLTKVISEKYSQQHQFNAGAATELDKLKKEFEVMQVRQHTLEKRIVSNQRTVNLIFSKPIPVEMVPQRVEAKPKRGRGRSALIPEQ